MTDFVTLTTTFELEKLYLNGLVFLQPNLLLKGRVAAPVGTIREISGQKYIKTNDGWRYYKKDGGAKKPDEESGKGVKKTDEEGSNSSKSVFEEGHKVKAPDGTEGEIVTSSPELTTIKYTSDGEEKTAQVPTDKLKERVEGGKVEHNKEGSKSETPEPGGKAENGKETKTDLSSKASQMKKEGSSSYEIFKKLREEGHSEEEILNSLLKSPPEGKEGKPSDEETDQSDEEDHEEDHEKSVSWQAKNEKNHKDYKSYADQMSEQEEGFSMKSQEKPKDEETDPETKEVNRRFEVLARNIKNVVEGGMKSAIAYGTGGVGKTYTVVKELEKAGKKPFEVGVHDPGDDDYDYVKITGKVTATDLYTKMLEHNGKILLFDDCDSVLQDKDAQNLFKGALDTSGDGTINWGSARPPKGRDGKPLPNAFAFNGKAIFVSNLDIKGNDKVKSALQPIISRGTGIDLSMSPKQTLKRIQSIAKDPKTGKLTNLKFPGIKYTHEDMEEVMAYLDKNKKNKDLELNVRTIGALLGIKKQAEKDGVDWKEDADYHALKKSKGYTSLETPTLPFYTKIQRLSNLYRK